MTFALDTLMSQGWPLLVLTAGALLSLLSAILPKGERLRVSAGLAVLTFAVAALGFYLKWETGEAATAHFLLWDPFGNFLGILVSLIGLATVIISYRYWTEQAEPLPEFYCLILFGVLGMVLMTATTHLLTLVFGLEVMSLSLYVLVALRRGDPVSAEAAFKYFLLGSVVTAFLLFGISFLYGATGTMDLWGIAEARPAADMQTIFKLGAILVLLAFAFKVAAVPLHFWAPDVYDGAPAPVTGFMATGVKVAAFGALIRVTQALVPFDYIPVKKLILALALATMVLGNLAALRQRSLKRIMAYSSISHAGYLLLGVATLFEQNRFVAERLGPILFYFLAYSLLTLGVFGVLTALSGRGREVGNLSDLDGLSAQHPVLAAVLSLFLISLAGIPPSAGFLAKYYLFLQAIDTGLYYYAVLGILASAASLYYYLGPVVRMYFRSGKESPTPVLTPFLKSLLALFAVGVLYLGIWPTQGIWIARETRILGAAERIEGMGPSSP